MSFSPSSAPPSGTPREAGFPRPPLTAHRPPPTASLVPPMPALDETPHVRAPDFPDNLEWVNTAGRRLGLADLRGRIVLLDFWTYG